MDGLIKYWLCSFCIFIFHPAFSQSQGCPVNINFSYTTLDHWFAYTGNNQAGNGPSAIHQTYDSTSGAPTGTIGVKTLYEYGLPSVPGIQTLSNIGNDAFGGFSTIPTINGYQYNYSVLLGSTSVSHSSNSAGSPGGYIRGISYKITVPTSSESQPYTMTYAYAMVLENGAHNSNEQPLISATLQTADSVIHCASPAYYLPTLNNASSRNGSDATLDTTGAILNGFRPSSKASPNLDRKSGRYLYDVWTKGWTEVTFDLSPYRGQQVTLTFEADNCVPGGHFAYGYIAIRDRCDGLIISGDSSVCSYSSKIYSVPALANANYQWTVPDSWTINSGSNTNIIDVTVGNKNGSITAKEQNGCANLADTLPVKTTPPSVGGNVSGSAEVCSGNNSSKLSLSGNTGNILNWVSTTDGIRWINIPDITAAYTAQNLTATTLYEAVVQTAPVCPADTSSGATIIVDPKTVGGSLSPGHTNICEGQIITTILTLTGNTGRVINWQSSLDSINWANFNPTNTDSTSAISSTTINASTNYRTIVKSGVCEADTSAVAAIQLFDVPFPQSTIYPVDTTICYGKSAALNATVSDATNYKWINAGSLTNLGDGIIGSAPFSINVNSITLSSDAFVLAITNNGCPNALMDTFYVNVIPFIVVNAGDDTSIVINQPLQLQAISSDSTTNSYAWSPATGLDNTHISNPIATLGAGVDSMTYNVTATDATGCIGTGSVQVKIYNVPAGLYVPTAFTPNGDGLNDIFKPITLGIKSLSSFRIYNRWGQLVFATSNIGQGWDGTFNGALQSAGSYVWITDGIDYKGNYIQKKGNVVLIR
jgi:gliding motility-associated-like protein